MNKTDYFEYNGVRYYSGTRFTMKEPKYESAIIKARYVENSFNGESIHVFYEPTGTVVRGMRGVFIKKENIPSTIIEILDGNYYEELEQSKRYIDDSKIPELIVGWMMYLVVMAALTIFNDRWLGWIVASIFFFNWRKKIKEKNTYYTKKDI